MVTVHINVYIRKAATHPILVSPSKLESKLATFDADLYFTLLSCLPHAELAQDGYLESYSRALVVMGILSSGILR